MVVVGSTSGYPTMILNEETFNLLKVGDRLKYNIPNPEGESHPWQNVIVDSIGRETFQFLLQGSNFNDEQAMGYWTINVPPYNRWEWYRDPILYDWFDIWLSRGGVIEHTL